jgi:hypothetical protein
VLRLGNLTGATYTHHSRLAIRCGNKLEHLISWRNRDTMAGVGQFILEFRKAGLEAKQIWGDNGGTGKVMIDALAQAILTLNVLNSQWLMVGVYSLATALQKVKDNLDAEVSPKDADDFVKSCMAIITNLSLEVDSRPAGNGTE